MLVLAIDPGSVTAGYALLKKEVHKIIHLDSGILRFNAKDEFLLRVNDIYTQTSSLIEKYAPDEIALESLIYVKSPTALIKLAQSRGVMLSALSQKYHGKIFEYSPNLIKQTVTGHGHASKDGIQKILFHQLGMTDFKTHDESDAVAIALCHLLSSGMLHHRNASQVKKTTRSGRGLAGALAHKIKEVKI